MPSFFLVRGVDERETVVSDERLDLTGPRGQPPRDIAPDEGRFHDKGALFSSTRTGLLILERMKLT